MGTAPLANVMRAAQALSEDAQEMLVALLIEPFGDMVEGPIGEMADPQGAVLPPFADTDALKYRMEPEFGWALGVDYGDPAPCWRFWYVSEPKMEPRLGLRFHDGGAAIEIPFDIARRVQTVYADLPVVPIPV
jgi:hypothetical protein